MHAAKTRELPAPSARREAPKAFRTTRQLGRIRRMPAVSMTVNGKAVSGEVEGRTLLVEFLRGKPGPDRHPCRLRHQPVRRLRRACGRQGGEDLHGAGGRLRGCRGDHHRRPGQERQAAPDAGGLPRESWPAMRLLHAGHDHGGGRYREAQRQEARTRTPSATSWKATSAAAPAITTSSRPCRPARRTCKGGTTT